jgi:hypothetical protein
VEITELPEALRQQQHGEASQTENEKLKTGVYRF